MRTDDLLGMLRKSGTEGLLIQEVAEKFQFKIPGSASKLIKQLRAKGYVIDRNPETKRYILIKDPGVPSKSLPETQETPNETGDTMQSEDTTFFKISGKKAKILEVLIRSGSDGASTSDISKYSGVSEKNIAGHIHSLRHTDGMKIQLVDGKYILKGEKKHPLRDKGVEALPESNSLAELEAVLGDKRLIKGVSRIPRGTQLATYMDLIQKIIYYTKCALAMHETIDALEKISNGGEL